MKRMSIGQVAQVTGIPASTLRYYESIGLLPKPPRVSGWRQYNDTDLRHIDLIKAAQGAGLSLTEIKSLFVASDEAVSISDRWQHVATKKLAELDAVIERAKWMQQQLRAGLACDCTSLDDCALI